MKKIFKIMRSGLIAIFLVCVVIITGCSDNKKEDDFIGYLAKHYAGKITNFYQQNIMCKDGQIVFIGDSITEGYDLNLSYGDLNLKVYNRGISGDTTKGVLDRLKVSLYDIKPSKIVLMIGINDVYSGRQNKEVIENYENILKDIRTNLQSTEVFVLSILAPVEDFGGINGGEFVNQIMELNKEIAGLSVEYDCTYVDLFSSMVDEDNFLIRDYTYDGLHLNADGYAVWTNIMKEMFEV